jgi:hypothetical protein
VLLWAYRDEPDRALGYALVLLGLALDHLARRRKG